MSKEEEDNYVANVQAEMQRRIRSRVDGPITPFVLISRAIDAASTANPLLRVAAANALYEELQEHGFLVDGSEETGS